MKVVKKLLCLVLCLLCTVPLSGCGGILLAGIAALSDDRADKTAIISYVKDNESTLVECIKKNDFTQLNKNKIIKEINGKNDFVEFYCGGAGFGSATSYRGFYYSENDDMTSIWCASEVDKLSPAGGGYEWHEKDGDDSYYTEIICGHFYYYDASY